MKPVRFFSVTLVRAMSVVNNQLMHVSLRNTQAWIVCMLVVAGFCLPFAPHADAQRRVHIPPAESPPPPAHKSPAETKTSGEDTGFIVDEGIIMRKSQNRTPPPPTNLTVLYKLRYGEKLVYVGPDGKAQEFEQWHSFRDDISRLMGHVNNRLRDGNNYQSAVADLNAQHFDPLAIPLLYMAGDYDFVFTDSELKNLRQYILDGGTILFNAARGHQEFTLAVVREMRRIFPTKSFMRLAEDHPLFNGSQRIRRIAVQVSGGVFAQEPEVYSIDIGTRAAVILVPAGMGAAWSAPSNWGINPSMGPLGTHILGNDAISLGVNIVGYALSNTEYGRFLAQPFAEYEGATRKGDVFRFVMARYQGSWHLNPGIESNLPHAIHSMTRLDVDYSPHYVDLGERNLHTTPLVFMTGHYDFAFTEAEIANLRDYCSRGGLLVSVSGAGFSPYNHAFAREIARVFPDSQLLPIPPTHPMFSSSWGNVEKVTYTSAAMRNEPTLDRPVFYGIFNDNRLVVLFTPYDLFSEANREGNKYARGVVYDDALKILLNMVFYALDH